MSNIADPLTRANFGFDAIGLRKPRVRSHYGFVDFFKHITSVHRLVFALIERRFTFAHRED